MGHRESEPAASCEYSSGIEDYVAACAMQDFSVTPPSPAVRGVYEHIFKGRCDPCWREASGLANSPKFSADQIARNIKYLQAGAAAEPH